MSDASRSTNRAANIPDMTALSIAFPMDFESPASAPSDPKRTEGSKNKASRPPHRHDAGK
ncbi:MAG: hypothetical protein ACWA5W_02850 [Phycisphaerales bacterium]